MAGRRTILAGGGSSPHAGLRREITERAVLEAVVADHGPLSRAEIARRTSISPPTVSEAVRRLESDAILRPVGVRSGYAGAVATLYDLAPGAGVVLGAELDPTVIRIAAADLAGNVLAREEHPLAADTDEVAARVDGLVARMAGVVAAGPARERPVRAVVLAVANPVDPVSGSVIELPESAFPQGVVRSSDIEVGAGTLVLIDNAVNLAAVAEHERGAAVGAGTFVYLYVGRRRNVGLGLVVDGALVRGAHGLAGEIGYLPVEDHGAKPGLAAALGEHDLGADGENGHGENGHGENGHGESAHGESADGLPADALSAAGREIGRATTAVCAIVDPELVVLGGPVGMDPTLLEHVRSTVADLAPRETPVVASTLGASAPLCGAVVCARKRAWEELCAGR